MKRTANLLSRLSAILAIPIAGCVIFAQHATKAPAAHRQSVAAKKAGSPGASLQSLRNIGRAYYEQGKYVEAIEQFQKLVASGHALATDHLDLGLSLMQANRLNEALGEMTTAHQMDPKLTAAEYNLGILYKRELRYPDAEAALKRVIAVDPDDPAAWFNLGTVYFAQRKLEDALDAHQHVVAMGFAKGENFYVASLFHSFTTLVRLKRPEDAQKFLKLHEKMRDKVPGISLQNPALEGGKYGVILVPAVPVTEIARKATLDKVTFAAISEKLGIHLPALSGEPASEGRKEIKAADYSLDYARKNLLPLFGPSIAVGDYDGDGHPDLYVVNPAGTNHLFHNNGDGTFTDVTETAGVAGPGGSVSAVFADYDNSTKDSLFVVGLNGVTVYKSQGDGRFAEVTEKVGLKSLPGELDTRAVLFDADNDGFLDLVVTAYTNLNAPPKKDTFLFPDDFAGAATHFYRNNGEGKFTEASVSAGLAAAKGRMRGAAFADFDNDGYTDLFLYRDDGPPMLFQNLGEDKFVRRMVAPDSALAKMTVLDAHIADFNHDGNFDLAVWSSTRYDVLLNRDNFRFTPAPRLPAIAPPAGFFRLRGIVADVNGDSFADLLTLDASGKWRLVVNQAGRFSEGALELPAPPRPALEALVPTWLGAPGKLDLVGVTHEGQVAAYEKEGPPARWLELKMNGYKSNSLGIGSVVEFKAGNFYNKVMVTGGPVRVYAGDLTKLDVVRVT